ncbi:MAG: hypothetical protein M1823_004670 [Watsoniomyces obsoletus]|nr:MAG: hypothetical protein M1823_004670 [Watsoniomyces obsoletus]
MSDESEKQLRLPKRLLIRSSELQNLVRLELQAVLPSPGQAPLTSPSSPLGARRPHPALLAVDQRIGETVSAFDRSECETQQWITKYAPLKAAECLQTGQEALALRSWLEHLALNAAGLERCAPPKPKRTKEKRTKKKRLQSDELRDFIVTSDDEADEAEELVQLDPHDGRPEAARSLVRPGWLESTPHSTAGRRPKNVILLSGPSGSGKSTAVYAVAKELDYEVFEINSGSRRSGKDVLERVGDLSQNHTVQRSKESRVETSPCTDEAPDKMIPIRSPSTKKPKSIRSFFGPANAQHQREKVEPDPDKMIPIRSQSTNKPKSIRSFFGPANAQHQREKVEPDPHPVVSSVGSKRASPSRSSKPTKNSVILLEEVDVLFKDDGQFWSTILDLLLQSKRPIILTCNDENLVRLDSARMHGILRFTPPPVSLAVDLLLLVAAAEGHLLQRSAVEALYASKRHDLRGSIMEMEFWCQMAVGDRKGGLEWMHLDRPSNSSGVVDSDPIRVVSKETYLTGMGWSGHEAMTADAADVRATEESLATNLWNNWQVDVEDWHQGGHLSRWAAEVSTHREEFPAKPQSTCQAWDSFFNVLSTADVYSRYALAMGYQIPVDATQPPIPDRCRVDTVLGSRLLDVEPLRAYSRLSIELALHARLSAKHALHETARPFPGVPAAERPFSEVDFIDMVVHSQQPDANSQPLARTDFSVAFDPISEPASKRAAAPSTTLQASEFDRPLRIITEDLAPYVRAIIRGDLQVAEERRRRRELSDDGGRNAKRTRTTRASRSAFEGGDRSNMRRERWFKRDIDPMLVLKTGSEAWIQADRANGARSSREVS